MEYTIMNNLAWDTYPKTPIRKYKEEDRRDKLRAFLEWWTDYNDGTRKSESFYARSWGKARSTSHEWIKEFKIYEAELDELCE